MYDKGNAAQCMQRGTQSQDQEGMRVISGLASSLFKNRCQDPLLRSPAEVSGRRRSTWTSTSAHTRAQIPQGQPSPTSKDPRLISM